MSRFDETVKNDTPSLIVMFRTSNGREEFQWGMKGNLPLLGLIATIIHAQNELLRSDTWEGYEWMDRECQQEALVITWDDENKNYDWFLHRNTPAYSMVGMLERVKTQLINTSIAREQQQQQQHVAKLPPMPRLVGPDGRPLIM